MRTICYTMVVALSITMVSAKLCDMPKLKAQCGEDPQPPPPSPSKVCCNEMKLQVPCACHMGSFLPY